MFQRNISDCGYFRIDDIGRIEASAETDFNDGYVHILFLEVLEGHHRGQFEERWIASVYVHGHISLYKVDYIIMANGRTINADAFVKVQKMRRCI
ncbi:unknown [Prevotella sp. CAG:873]|nr:unknown [Prevotella sp. CAG:873]